MVVTRGMMGHRRSPQKSQRDFLLARRVNVINQRKNYEVPDVEALSLERNVIFLEPFRGRPLTSWQRASNYNYVNIAEVENVSHLTSNASSSRFPNITFPRYLATPSLSGASSVAVFPLLAQSTGSMGLRSTRTSILVLFRSRPMLPTSHHISFIAWLKRARRETGTLFPK
jgi:hypothetical protein